MNDITGAFFGCLANILNMNIAEIESGARKLFSNQHVFAAFCRNWQEIVQSAKHLIIIKPYITSTNDLLPFIIQFLEKYQSLAIINSNNGLSIIGAVNVTLRDIISSIPNIRGKSLMSHIYFCFL